MGFSKLEVWNMALGALPESHVDTIDDRNGVARMTHLPRKLLIGVTT